jgi:hypothetical protein
LIDGSERDGALARVGLRVIAKLIRVKKQESCLKRFPRKTI